MKASDLLPGRDYLLDDSREATVVNATPVPDGRPNQRKVLVTIDGEEEYILPRQIATAKPIVTKTVKPLPTKKVVRRSLALDDPRLDMFRPDPSVVETYVSRKMANGQRDIDYFLECWRRKENVLLVGDTQAGKSLLVRVLAVLAGNVMGLGKPLPVFTLSGSSGITDFDLFGQPQSWTDDDGKERLVWLPGVVDLASRVGGILDLDEIGMMGERVTSSLHPVCDWRRMFVNRNKPVLVPGDGFMPEQVKVSDDLWIVATTNPSTYRGSGTLNEAFANRFRHIMWDYDESVEKVLIRNEGVLALGEALRNARAVNHVRTPIGTAALIRCAQDVERDGVDMALFCLVSMFTSDERPVVNEIIESRSYRGLISKAASDGGSIFDLPDEDQPF